jgi:C-terminal processing protease CtpA/Prc
MVIFLASYLFDRPEYMFNPGGPLTEQAWTRSPVAGSLLVDKPVYILTSSRTYSGAEQFSYDLKMLRRATLVGETTGGASHANVLHNVDDHFAVGIPEHKPVNPFSDKDWAVTGIEPDLKVEAADAILTAQKLAETKLRKR